MEIDESSVFANWCLVKLDASPHRDREIGPHDSPWLDCKKRWLLGSGERLSWIVENLYLNRAEKRIYSCKFSNINYSKKMKSEAFKPVLQFTQAERNIKAVLVIFILLSHIHQPQVSSIWLSRNCHMCVGRGPPLPQGSVRTSDV